MGWSQLCGFELGDEARGGDEAGRRGVAYFDVVEFVAARIGTYGPVHEVEVEVVQSEV